MARPSNLFVAALWMVVISIALFFLPLINGLIGGAVGGYKAGNMKRGVLAALIPAAVVAGAVWLLLVAYEAPIAGFFAGTAAGILVALADIGLFIGALIGGAYAQRDRYRTVALR